MKGTFKASYISIHWMMTHYCD